jgi:argonaute-like protein implicated in RNA metabolism and viral defense
MAFQNIQLFVEVFPILTSTLPQMFAYKLETGGEDASTIGGKLAYRLRRKFKGHWVWASERVVTDTQKPLDEIMSFVEQLWREQPDIFKDLRSVTHDTNWTPTPYAQAIFVANGLFGDIEDKIKQILSRRTQSIGDARVERIHEVRGSKTFRIEPAIRSQIVKEISDIAIKKKWVVEAYNSKNFPNIFNKAYEKGFTSNILFGGGKVDKYDEKTLLRNLYNHGLYKISSRFQGGSPINIGIISALKHTRTDKFCQELQKTLEHLNFESNFVSEEKIQGFSRVDLENAIESLQTKKPDILLVFFPDELDEDDEEWGAYYHLKSLTVGRGIASQVVYQSTLDNQYAMANIVLGILGKTGNIPFILAEPLPYADLVVGIDIAHERKKRLAGSINATAIARIYFSNGEFLRYVLHDAPLEGETIPENVLQSLFPIGEFKGKRVVIHRDGYFRGEEKQALKDWAQKIGAEFYLVEVIKTGTPRLYRMQGEKIQQPFKGDAFKLSSTEAFLVSSLPPFKDATPQPLRIRTDGTLTIEQAIHSVLSLTLLHYGSVRPPRLPVTIHYSDRIAYLALRGIKPKDLEGIIPFWL